MAKNAERTHFERDRVYAVDIRNAGLWYCGPGIRVFFTRRGLNLRDFLDNGISFAELEATGDSMALKAIEFAKKRQEA